MKFILLLSFVVGLSMAAPNAPPSIHTTSLLGDLLEFVALIPIDDLKTIADDHLATDVEFGDVIRYLQGPEWAKLVAEVDAKPAVQDLKKYLNDAGLPVDLILELIHELIANAKPGTNPGGEQVVVPFTLRSFLDEVEAALPLDKMKALLEDKMQNSEDFKALYAKISSQKAHDLVEEVRKLPEVIRVADRLREMGVKVDAVLDAVYAFLGWN